VRNCRATGEFAIGSARRQQEDNSKPDFTLRDESCSAIILQCAVREGPCAYAWQLARGDVGVSSMASTAATATILGVLDTQTLKLIL
jgi:hypothetical protein